jgi:hypothetical protein
MNKDVIADDSIGWNDHIRRQEQFWNAHLLISLMFSESSMENMDLHPINMYSGITVMRGGILKLVKMQAANA